MKERRFRWWMVWLLIGPITFVMSLDRTAIVVAAPVIQKEYGFSLVEMSLILTSFSWTYAFLQVPAGWLAERVGPRRALYWANLLWSILTAATPAGFSLTSFVAIRAALGVGPGRRLACFGARAAALVPASGSGRRAIRCCWAGCILARSSRRRSLRR